MRHPRPTALAVPAAMGFAIIASGEAQAQVPVTLDYSVVSACPQVDYFKSIVVERLGDDVFAETAPYRVLVRVNSRGGSFEGSLEWRDVAGNWAGERTFPARSNDCEDLVRAMAFTLALQLQFSVAASAPPSATAMEPTQAKDAKPTTPAPIREEPRPVPTTTIAPAERPPLHPRHASVLAIGAGPLIGFGMSSSAIPLVRAFGSIATSHWSLSLAAELSAPTTIRRSDNAGFSHHQWLAVVTGCRNWEAWSACLVAKGGQIRVAGKDIDVPASNTAALIQVGIRAGATQRMFQRAYVSVYAEALVVPILWTATLDQSAVFTSPRFAQTIGLDVGLRFE